MITNHILENKWRVQRALSEQAGHDPSKYIELAHKRAAEAQEYYGIRFRYAKVEVDSKEEPLPDEPCEAAELSLAADGSDSISTTRRSPRTL
jgi:hypothetical protein